MHKEPQRPIYLDTNWRDGEYVQKTAALKTLRAPLHPQMMNVPAAIAFDIAASGVMYASTAEPTLLDSMSPATTINKH